MTEPADPRLDPYATGLVSASGEANASTAAAVRVRHMRPRSAVAHRIQDMLLSSLCIAHPSGDTSLGASADRLAGQVLGGRADADDLAAVVDAEQRGEGGAGPPDQGEPPSAQHEPGDRPGRAGQAEAHDLAAVVDVAREGDLRAGGLEGGDPLAVEQVAVRGGEVTGIAGDLAAVVDPSRGVRQGVEAALLPQVAVEGVVGGLVLAHHLAAVVDV